MPQTCIICQNPDSLLKYVIDSFEIVQCTRCKLIYLKNPVSVDKDTETYDHYFEESTVLEYRCDSASPAMRTLWAINEQRLDWIDRLQGVTSILDTGSGRGHFMAHAASRGYRVQGIEISPIAALYSEKTYGLKPYVLNLDHSTWHIEDTFDLITMWHVLEHLSDPITVLKKLGNCLKPHGRLIVEVPNINSIKFRLARPQQKWVGGNHPRHHRFFFSHHSLKNMLLKSGFHEPVFVKDAYCIPDYSHVTNLLKRCCRRLHRDAFLTLIVRR